MKAFAMLIGVVLVLLGTAAPAAADPARPTEYRSIVEEVEPATDAIEVEVRGGDAFLEVTVEPGHEVLVEGYQQEPYIRVLADGTVERNRLSPATWINEARFGTETPPEADHEADPEWEVVADGGEYAWHDHRIHWMQLEPPPVEPGEVVSNWTVRLTVDGEEIEVRGRLERVAGVSPVPWIGIAVVVGAALLLAGRRRLGPAPVTLAAGTTLVASVVATVLGAAEWSATPAGARTLPLLIILPALAALLAAGALAVVAFRRSRQDIAGLLAMGSVALLGGWVFVRLPVFWKPVLPSDVPSALDRAGVAIALGIAVAAGVALVRATRQLNRPPAPSPSP
jgi:hypothetical protein